MDRLGATSTNFGFCRSRSPCELWCCVGAARHLLGGPSACAGSRTPSGGTSLQDPSGFARTHATCPDPRGRPASARTRHLCPRHTALHSAWSLVALSEDRWNAAEVMPHGGGGEFAQWFYPQLLFCLRRLGGAGRLPFPETLPPPKCVDSEVSPLESGWREAAPTPHTEGRALRVSRQLFPVAERGGCRMMVGWGPWDSARRGRWWAARGVDYSPLAGGGQGREAASCKAHECAQEGGGRSEGGGGARP